MRIYKNDTEDWYTLEFTDVSGYIHYIDPFKTYNEAYEFYLRWHSRQDDLK